MGLSHRESAKIHERNRKVIPGGFVSVNRAVEPEIAFVRGKGCRVWDADGNEYIDYHAAFAPYILGHADPDVTGAVQKVLETVPVATKQGSISLAHTEADIDETLERTWMALKKML